MSPYQVLARRYRPQTFADLVGQEGVVRTLRNAVLAGQVHHAYVFSGPRGVGKTTAARVLAKALNCEQGPTPDPCGECVPCREIADGTSMDVLEIDAASNRGIDSVRELREVARVLPVRDRFRVFILDEAHQLTGEAFNALLKILEEPPAHVVFVLASTEKHKFPATVLSRCQQLDFRPLPTALIAQRLREVAEREGFVLEEPAAQRLARASQGSLRDGLSLLDQVRAFAGAGPVNDQVVTEVLGLPPVEVLCALWRALCQGQASEALALLAERERQGDDLILLYHELMELLRVLVLATSNPETPWPYPAELREELLASSAQLGLPNLLRMLSLAVQGRELLAAAPSPGLGVMVAVGKLTLWPRLQRVEALLAGGEVPLPAAALPEQREGGKVGASSPAEQFLEAVASELGATLAARLRSACQMKVAQDELELVLRGAPNATLKAVQEALPRLEELARAQGVASRVRLVVAEAEPTLMERVTADPRVQAVLQVFGGKVVKVEEGR
ncbi:MAG: DNA polymerase III subunit gamma/tau [Thermoanaerobaculum sp.]|nr:DNA polymerase III subunit gamma/tau [Thermoanaerobaculum sp.]